MHASPSPATSTAGRILAIDYGRRRIGLALSDALGLTAQPLETLARANRRNDLRRLREIVRANDVRRIIVGHPLHLDGSASEMAAEAARFAARIEKELRVPVELMDERLTSWEAAEIVATRKAAARKRSGNRARQTRNNLHQIAAAIILRDYLERARLGSAHPQPRRAEA